MLSFHTSSTESSCRLDPALVHVTQNQIYNRTQCCSQLAWKENMAKQKGQRTASCPVLTHTAAYKDTGTYMYTGTYMHTGTYIQLHTGLDSRPLTNESSMVAALHGQIAQHVTGAAGVGEGPPGPWLRRQHTLLLLPPPSLL